MNLLDLGQFHSCPPYDRVCSRRGGWTGGMDIRRDTILYGVGGIVIVGVFCRHFQRFDRNSTPNYTTTRNRLLNSIGHPSIKPFKHSLQFASNIRICKTVKSYVLLPCVVLNAIHTGTYPRRKRTDQFFDEAHSAVLCPGSRAGSTKVSS